MVRKCKRCGKELPDVDGHVFCGDCRAAKKGDDPCVKGKTCRLCDRLKKSSETSKVDDSLLDAVDDTTNPSTGVNRENTLAALNSTLASLQERMTSLEARNQPTPAATRANAPGAPEMIEPDPFKDTASFGEEEGLDLEVKEDDDKEVDATYLEMLQAVKQILNLSDPEVDTFYPPSAFK